MDLFPGVICVFVVLFCFVFLKHLTQICIKALFYFSLNKREKGKKTFFSLNVCYKPDNNLYIISFNFHNNPLRVLWSQFHRWGNWGIKRLNNLPEDTHPAISETWRCWSDSRGCAFSHDTKVYHLLPKPTTSLAPITRTHHIEKWWGLYI